MSGFVFWSRSLVWAHMGGIGHSKMSGFWRKGFTPREAYSMVVWCKFHFSCAPFRGFMVDGLGYI